MSRLLGIGALYLAMFLGWAGVGLWLIFAPGRAGNLLHNGFGWFSEDVAQHNGTKLLLRLSGIGLLAFAVRFAFGVFALLRQGG